MRFSSLSLLLVAICSVSAMKNYKNQQPAKLELVDVAKFVEGLIYGIVKQESQGLDTCISDVETIGSDVAIAVGDFEKETFDGVKAGLLEIGNTVKLIPGAVKDCKSVETDLSNIVKMAEIFASPLSLIYHVGKNLIVNGIDIFKKIA